MKIINKDQFFEITKSFEWIPYTQTYGWYSFFCKDEKDDFLFLIDDKENPQIACFGHIKRALGFKMLMIEGECALKSTFSNVLVRNFYKAISELPYDMIEVNSNSLYDFEFEIGLRRAGFLRPVGVFSVPLSILVSLNKPIEYDRNWMRNLKKSKQHNLQFDYISKPSSLLIKEFVDTYNILSDFKGFGTKLNFTALNHLLEDSKMRLFLVRDKAGKVLCFRIVYVQKETATDIFAANTLESREFSATHFMMDALFAYLSKNKLKHFDFARILVGHPTADSVFLFKNGVRGKKVLYNGEWSFYKKKYYRPLMYFVKRWLFKKREL